MPFTSLQLLRPAFIVSIISLGLGGCLSKNPADVTGSIDSAAYASASPEALRASSDSLAARYEANPGDAATAVAYARVLRARGQHAQAVAVLQQASLRHPQDLVVMSSYGKALADAGRLREAAEVLPRAHHPERPDWRILSVQGAIADQLGQFDQAQRFYDAALKIVPGEPSVLSNQGLSFALARRLPDAERILVDAAGRPGADARVRHNLALVLGLQGKYAAAEAALQRDMSPADAAAAMAEIRKMGRQPARWAAVQAGDGGESVAVPARIRASQLETRNTPSRSAADLQ